MFRSDVAGALRKLADAGSGLEQDARGRLWLMTPVSPLDALRIRDGLGAYANLFTIEVVDQTGSTNDDLMRRARSGAPDGLVRVAEMQTAGRGRRHRSWISVPGGALTFSLLRNFEGDMRRLMGLPLAVGVAIVRSLSALALQHVQLKWPNDVLLEKRKLGGILIETCETAGTIRAVIGIGLNVRLGAAVLERIGQPAADLESAGLAVDRNELLARLLVDLQDVLVSFSARGFAALRSEWERVHAYQDKMVTLDMAGGNRVTGKVLGVDNAGALVMQTDRGQQVFHGGELSLRPEAT